MNDDLDRALADEPGIDPSPVFVRSVMAAVEREAAAPPPIPFPWLRAAPIAVAALGVVMFVVYAALVARPSAPPPSAQLADALLQSVTPAVLWVAVSLLVSAASVLAVRVER
jgi:hypothetical protein